MDNKAKDVDPAAENSSFVGEEATDMTVADWTAGMFAHCGSIKVAVWALVIIELGRFITQ